MQLSAYENVTPENVKFTEAKEFKVKDSNIKYKRIPIEISYGNNKKGPLVIETPTLFSFGVSEKKNQEPKSLLVTLSQYVFGRKIANQMKKSKHFLM